MASQSITENVKISINDSLGHFVLKQHKLWFDKSSKLLDSNRLKWFQNPRHINRGNMNN
jgi:hypothetical protein